MGGGKNMLLFAGLWLVGMSGKQQRKKENYAECLPPALKIKLPFKSVQDSL